MSLNYEASNEFIHKNIRNINDKSDCSLSNYFKKLYKRIGLTKSMILKRERPLLLLIIKSGLLILKLATIKCKNMINTGRGSSK